jgi:hypothetical protein
LIVLSKTHARGRYRQGGKSSPERCPRTAFVRLCLLSNSPLKPPFGRANPSFTMSMQPARKPDANLV